MLEGGIKYSIGTWDSDTEDKSSDLREFKNVMDTLHEDEAAAGNLQDALIFLCTDNSTVEAALVKGNSSSEKLFELTLEVWKLEMQEGACIIVVFHGSGEQMKAQGTDGVSQGQLKDSVSTSKEMLSFIPFHLPLVERSPAVETWLWTWLGQRLNYSAPTGGLRAVMTCWAEGRTRRATSDMKSSLEHSFGTPLLQPLQLRWKNSERRRSSAKTHCKFLSAHASLKSSCSAHYTRPVTLCLMCPWEPSLGPPTCMNH
jgi:hypothetical protein